MMSAVDHIRMRAEEAEACQALLRPYPSDAIAARIGAFRAALAEAQIAAEEEAEARDAFARRSITDMLTSIRAMGAHHGAGAGAVQVPPAATPVIAEPPPATAPDLPTPRPAIFAGDEITPLDPATAARLPQPEAPPAAEPAAPEAPTEQPEASAPAPPPIHPLSIDPQPEPPAEAEDRPATLAEARTPERDARLRELWPRLSWANGHILTALDAMPGPRIPRSKGTLHYWAAKLGLPTARFEAYGDPVPDTTAPEPPPAPAPEPPPAPAPEPPPPATPAPPPTAAADIPAHEGITLAHRLRGQGHDARSIARRTGLDAAKVEALEADAKRLALDYLRQGALSTEDIATECGLPPATIRTLRASVKGRAA